MFLTNMNELISKGENFMEKEELYRKIASCTEKKEMIKLLKTLMKLGEPINLGRVIDKEDDNGEYFIVYSRRKNVVYEVEGDKKYYEEDRNYEDTEEGTIISGDRLRAHIEQLVEVNLEVKSAAVWLFSEEE